MSLTCRERVLLILRKIDFLECFLTLSYDTLILSDIPHSINAIRPHFIMLFVVGKQVVILIRINQGVGTDNIWELNHKLFRLYCLTANSKLARANMVRASIEYFVVCADEENDAYQVKGQYKTITGIVLKVDQTEQRITIRSGADTEVIPFSDIYRIFKPTG